jgi:hypothetical protein
MLKTNSLVCKSVRTIDPSGSLEGYGTGMGEIKIFALSILLEQRREFFSQYSSHLVLYHIFTVQVENG